MPEPKDTHQIADAFRRELENATISRPDWELDHSKRSRTSREFRRSRKPFLDAILEVIAKSIEQALADVMARCVGEGVQRAIRPLAGEIALLRIAIEHDWDSANRRRQSTPHEKEDFEE